MNTTKSLITAVLLSSVALVSFAQTPAAKPKPSMTEATTAGETANTAGAASKPMAKHHKQKAKKAMAPDSMASAANK